MASKNAARRAKAHLAQKLGEKAWLRGIGLGGAGKDSTVQVNVDQLTPQVLAAIPKKVLGVQVEVEEVGEISAQPADPHAP